MKENAIVARDNCLMGGCTHYMGYSFCKSCGFNKYEDQRRKRLPMVKGKDGLWRKYVGRGKKDE